GQLIITDGKQGLNALPTRYVGWTSWLAAKSIWSSASGVRTTEGDGSGLPAGTYFRISIQGESDGMATFAHEFGHIKSIADNYNNPYGIPDGRSYTGPWELMSRGSFAGPVGTHTRWMTPGTEGSSVPAHHTTRLKLKQAFYEEDQYTRTHEEYLIENGPVFETIVARNVPTAGEWGIGYGVNSLMIDMDKDNTPIVTKNDPEYNWQTSTWGSMRNATYADKGYYQFYSMEVVQRTGYDSFSPDEGVLIIMNREIDNENAPFMWVIDANPDDIDLVDFERSNGEDAMVSLGDARQLADALFHAGTGEGVVSEYFDEYNNLHFYVLDKMYDEAGVLSYRVAVRSDEFTGSYDDGMTVKLGDSSPAKAGNVASQEVIITNTGSQPGLYRLSSSNDEDWAWAVASEVIEVAPGETVTIPLYFEVPDFRPADNDFDFTVTSEVSGKSVVATGEIEPDNGAGVVRPGKDDKDDEDDEDEPIIVVPEKELPFIDVATNAWYYNDVLVAWKDGLVNGRTETTYVPDGNITIAEAIKLASTMHQKYTAGAVTLTNGTDAWYSTYVAYAVANGIIKDGEYTDMNAIATRAQFASIFAAALPAEALAAINAVEDGKIPDVKMADSYGAAVYKLYNAGILTGNDAIGTFAPMSNIKRSEVAAIVNRMMHVENRKNIAL
ncbi:MAG: S-layer homology domain-containing protein, partial [Firmicutes bacterium]|nr:S-layer homology domain-containing protein [Bacillota bacterium]